MVLAIVTIEIRAISKYLRFESAGGHGQFAMKKTVIVNSAALARGIKVITF